MRLERKFISVEDVERAIKNNENALKIINDLGGAAWYVIPQEVARFVNAKRISEDDVDNYIATNQIINASNQFLWAYGAVNPEMVNHYAIEPCSKIIKILYDTDIIQPSEETAQQFIGKSLNLAERAVEADDFEDKDIAYILSSYLARGLRTGERGSKNPLLVRFMNEMKGKEGIVKALDFFDAYVSNGFTHPFPQYGFALDEPYMVKDRDILDTWYREFRGHSWDVQEVQDNDAFIRLCASIANFNHNAESDMQAVLYQSNLGGGIFRDRIKRVCGDVSDLTDIKGEKLEGFLQEKGFAREVVLRYLRMIGAVVPTAEDPNIPKKEYSHNLDIKEAMEIFELKELPKDPKIVKRIYRRAQMMYHPDKSDLPEAEQKSKDFGSAWKVLKDFYLDKGSKP